MCIYYCGVITRLVLKHFGRCYHSIPPLYTYSSRCTVMYPIFNSTSLQQQIVNKWLGNWIQRLPPTALITFMGILVNHTSVNNCHWMKNYSRSITNRDTNVDKKSDVCNTTVGCFCDIPRIWGLKCFWCEEYILKFIDNEICSNPLSNARMALNAKMTLCQWQHFSSKFWYFREYITICMFQSTVHAMVGTAG